MNFKKSMPYVFAGLAMLAIASCKKDNEKELLVKPDVAEQLANGGKDSITMNETLILHPKLKNTKNAIYSWTVNGARTGSDSVFTFNAATKGDFKINFKAATNGGEVSLDYQIHVWDKYENGFYIVNEGWFGHGTGTVSFYRYNTGKMEDSIFVKENPLKDLEPKSSTLQSGVIFNKKFYLVSKVNGPMVVTDEYTMKEIARIPSQGGNDWRSFVGINESKGLISGGSGVYPLNLNTLAIGQKITNVTGQVGDMIKQGDYIFVLSATDGVVILNAADNTVVKKIAGATIGFTKTIDGNVWAAGGTKLFKINATLDVETITVPFNLFGSWGAWHPGSITASTRENAVFFAKNGSFSGGSEIYKYIPGNDASLQAAFLKLPAGKIFYGAGLSYNAKLDQLLVSTVQSGFGENFKVNNLYFYDPVTAAVKKTVSYDGYYFPSVIVAHN
ncbi:hypothetical protein HDE68_000764 [Pedobacter cryoconitis]|uniref:Bacteroidetes PKD-like domain-containing protein n=1 Tax=Pedobacter cryoconitis TaxID=188932 RepID=A0A7W8ZIW8_9SPHI|nr:DUF5074 domain-containing protein [Pedobacter cryoconitis]MBB5634879.1 hypothetical protein [Pedobacter cryoconitis]